MPTIHDNLLKSFFVNCEEECIVWHTLGPDGSRTDVVFGGVCAYAFKNDLMKSGNILFDIEPLPMDDFLKKYHDSLARGKAYGWPGCISYEKTGELAERLAARKLTPFEIDSSLGLTGFVLAQSMELVAIQPNAIL